MADKLLVATKSFITTDEDGRRLVVRAGKSRFRESHPIAQKFAAAFKDADSQPGVETTRADAAPAPAPAPAAAPAPAPAAAPAPAPADANAPAKAPAKKAPAKKQG